MRIFNNGISRRALMQNAAGAIALRARAGWAQSAGTWPDHPVHIIVPYPPGGSTDVLYRLLADNLKEKLGQPFEVTASGPWPGPGSSGGCRTNSRPSFFSRRHLHWPRRCR